MANDEKNPGEDAEGFDEMEQETEAEIAEILDALNPVFTGRTNLAITIAVARFMVMHHVVVFESKAEAVVAMMSITSDMRVDLHRDYEAARARALVMMAALNAQEGRPN